MSPFITSIWSLLSIYISQYRSQRGEKNVTNQTHSDIDVDLSVWTREYFSHDQHY